METYTIIVRVTAKSQGAAFQFVETALEHLLPITPTNTTPQRIHIATKDGTRATELDCPEVI